MVTVEKGRTVPQKKPVKRTTKRVNDRGLEGDEDWKTHPYLVIVSDKSGDEYHTQFRTLTGAKEFAQGEVDHMAPFELKKRDVSIFKRDEIFENEPWAGYSRATYSHEKKKLVGDENRRRDKNGRFVRTK